MSVLGDIANALNSYPVDQATLDIVELQRDGDSSDTHISSGEHWKFKVKLTNNGHVNMTHVSLLIKGLNGTTVSESATGSFGDSMVVADLNPPGDDFRTTNFYFFKAPQVDKTVTKDLVQVQINDWNGNFDHYFSNHTLGVEAAEGKGIFYPKFIERAEVNAG
jgi:hypothetical protein